jgi:hypothetical protein
LSISRPESDEDWRKLETVLERASQPLRSEFFLMLDMDIRRALVERRADLMSAQIVNGDA